MVDFLSGPSSTQATTTKSGKKSKKGKKRRGHDAQRGEGSGSERELFKRISKRGARCEW